MYKVDEKQDQFGTYVLYSSGKDETVIKVSIIMSSYNSVDTIKRAIHSILEQSFKDFEFIIVDDGSSDSSFDILMEYLDQDQRVKIIKQNNIGLTKSLIRAIEVAQGDFIARQDADDFSSHDRLERQFALRNKYDFICARTMINDERKLPKWISTKIYKILIYNRNIFVHGTFLFSKAAYYDVGGYDPEFKYSQDYDLVAKFIKNRKKIKFIDNVLYHSYKTENSISNARLKEQNFYADKVKEYLKACK